MERFIAIDHVCAWPNLTRMVNGEIIATIFNQPCHGQWEGDVDCWASTDGRFWQKRGTPAPHEPGTVRMNVAAGAAGDGALVVLASGWSDRPPRPEPMPVFPHDPSPASPEEKARQAAARVLEPWVCRSVDGGCTWTRSKAVERPAEMACLIPFGDIARDDDGHLCAALYGWDTQSTRREGKRLAWFFRSNDDGQRWKPVSMIGPDNSNEPTVLHIGGGKWLAAVRTAKEKMMQIVASSDNGASWQSRGAVTLPGQITSHLMRLADGRVLLHFGIRNQGLHGVGVRVSEDGGSTWGPPRVILTYGVKADGGYPSCVQLDDGMLVTAYYAQSTAGHERYHMGVLRWRIDEA